MVRTLQRKFIIASMAAVTILLGILIGAINALNWYSVSERQSTMLEILCESDARPGLHMDDGGRNGAEMREDRTDDRGQPENLPKDLSEDNILYRDRQEGERGLFQRRFSMDDALSARYFAVWFDAEGEILRTDVSQIYAVTAEEAAAIGQEIYAGGRKTGTRDSFRYLLCEVRDREPGGMLNQDSGMPDLSGTAGTKMTASSAAGASGPGPESILVAMDISGDRQDLVSVLGISAAIALICWGAMLIPVHALARLAIAPTALSIERQKQFVTNAGHELKTPLAIIQANTDAIELYNGATKWTRNIRTQTVRLSGLMQNLLTLSKMDETGLRLERSPLDLRSLAAEVWDSFAEPAAGRGLTFAMEAEEGADLRALCNRDSLSQLFSILFDNAVKYTPRGGSIGLRIFRDAHGICIEQSNTIAADDGDDRGGIPEEPDRLFERFYRADFDRSRKKGGYGIGLSAARAIAGANSGTIQAAVSGGRILLTVRLQAAQTARG